MEDNNTYLNTKELAQKLSIPVNTIYYWIAQSKIPYVKVGKHHRFLYKEVMDFFRNKTLNKGK